MESQNIEIRNTVDGRTEVYIGGYKIRGVRRFELKQEVGMELPVLTLDLNALNISTDTAAIVRQVGYGEIGIVHKGFNDNYREYFGGCAEYEPMTEETTADGKKAIKVTCAKREECKEHHCDR